MATTFRCAQPEPMPADGLIRTVWPVGDRFRITMTSHFDADVADCKFQCRLKWEPEPDDVLINVLTRSDAEQLIDGIDRHMQRCANILGCEITVGAS